MADLEKRNDRKDWLRWAIVLLRRGVWAGDIITVHGPHPGSPCMWGETEGQLDIEPGDFNAGFIAPFATFKFRTANGIRSIYDVRGVRVRDKGTGEKMPLVPATELSPKARRWLAVARCLMREIDE